jgi:hypothetical protein
MIEQFYIYVKDNRLYKKGCKVKVISYVFPVKEAYHIRVGDPSDEMLIIRSFPVDKFHEYFESIINLRIKKISKIKLSI